MIMNADTFKDYLISYVVETTCIVIGRIYIDPLIQRMEQMVQKLIIFLAKKFSFCERIFRDMLVKQLM